MAGHPMIGLNLQKGRDLYGTDIELIRAASMKITPRGWIDGAGHFPLQKDSFPFQRGIWHWIG